MFLSPEQTVEEVGITQGALVADFGSGVGSYTFAIAKALQGSGRVYAVDVQKDLIVRLKKTAVEDGMGNVEVIWGDLEKVGGTKLRDQTVDVVFMVNILFQVEDRQGMLREAKRILKPAGKGRLLVIDWTGSFKKMGPTPEQVIAELNAKKMCESEGLIFERNIPAGSYHYGLLFHT